MNPATTPAPSNGTSARVATARSTHTHTASTPSASHGSGRNESPNGSHHAANAAAATHVAPGRRRAGPRRGRAWRRSRIQISSPSTVAGTRSHSTDGAPGASSAQARVIS